MKAVPDKNPAAAHPSPAHPAVSRTTATAAPARSPGDRPAPDRPAPDRRGLVGLQRAAGNRAVSRLVAQRYTAPVKPSPAQAPGFRKVTSDVAAKRVHLAHHAPAAAESKSAQDAAVAPPDDKEAQGKAANAEKMNAAKPGEFNKQAFIDAVNKAIDAQAPKNLDDADKFSKSGKADKIKGEVDGKVKDGKESSAKDIDTATKAPPDTSAAKDKPVTPMTPDQAPGNPGAPSAADAVPAQQPASVTDFSQGPAANDQAMADAEVTEDQLAKGNEPEFDQALSAKKTAETDSAKAPAKGKAAEAQQLSTAKAGAAASGAQAMNALTATRASAGKQVDGGKGETKSKDEKKRAEVTAKLQKVYDGTKKDVETTLSDLDKKVDTAFTSGEKAARDAFTADHKRRMKAYKDKRYSSWTGKARWVKDKFAGLPKEANNLYQEARKLYVAKMQTVISSVADIIGTELGKAKARIAKGRTELKAEVDGLPADLKQFGEDAAKDFAGKFDDLEATVNEKSEQLVQDLAQKYTAALNKVDEEIKKLQEANKGLIDKAKDAIVGVIKTINELKNLLLGILAKAASAIMKIIKDPIGFLGNLVRAVGAGLNLFITNVAEHLKTGVVSWLLGTAVKAGLELPQKFDLKGIIQLIGALLGLTWANIRARITRKGIPDQALTAVEQSVPVAKKLAAEGPAGAVKEIESEAGDLKATILEKLTSYLIPTVIIAGITWIISLLNPASAFVRAVKGIIDIVTFIVNQGAQIVDFVNAVLDAVIAIANGGSAGVPKMVEAALATSVPLLIGFLASLLGIGSLANKVKSVFHAVAKPVNRAIDKIVNFITKKGKALWNKMKTSSITKEGDHLDGKSKNRTTTPWWELKKGFTAPNGEQHTLLFSGTGPGAIFSIHSIEKAYKEYLQAIQVPADDTKRTAAKSKALIIVDQIEKARSSKITGAQKNARMTDLINKAATITAELIGNKGPIPASTPPVYGGLNEGGFATSMTVEVLTKEGLPGTAANPSTGSNSTWDTLSTRYELQSSQRRFYKAGHLLNSKLHGPGEIWANLAPQSESGNQSFERQVERKLKRLILKEGKGVQYSVTPVYNRSADYDGIVKEWEESGDQKINEKKAILRAEMTVPTAFAWSYKVVFENGEAVTDGNTESDTSDNDIRQEAGRYHVR
ncbi:DNA/RNA non-specific endonuclease [Streptomyces sp. NPDC054771]